MNYWDSIRPVPLEEEEQKDYRVKDSTARARRDSARSGRHLDSLRRKPQPVELNNIFLTGWGHTWYFRRDTAIAAHRFNMGSLIKGLEL